MSLKLRIKKTLAPAKWGLIAFLGRHPRLAALYFALADDSLSREAAGVLAGRARYRDDTHSPQLSYYLLRRNIHRLEKGLIMRPRRPVFAADYLPETVDVYGRSIRHAGEVVTSEHEWAHNVLTEYFSAVDRDHPAIAPEWKKFQRIDAAAFGVDAPTRIPYTRALADAAPVAFDDFMTLSMRRRSVRWYLDKPVPRELVDKALDAATQAPSACNRQPFVYRIFDDPAQARKLAAIPMGTKGFSDQLQAVVVLVGRLRAYPEARDRHAIYIDASLSAMSFMYALETLGLSSCPINWPDCQPQEHLIAEAMNLEPDERVIMLIAYGWPDPEGMVPYSAKREHSQLRSYNV
ncbi:nitroreductase family protein [Sphingomonas montanisoli]|uniref:Nitroreductase family protein n=1 Tax=Sphingomonas montanisoli TaxID=2606412 RepID=A0A5D9C253_9SPHN|nr:nitroreductase family protein [Sphingomonas montanisoli]TZG25844.1 nitroreductase family protein [Sphingomonas montanisoli]